MRLRPSFGSEFTKRPTTVTSFPKRISLAKSLAFFNSASFTEASLSRTAFSSTLMLKQTVKQIDPASESIFAIFVTPIFSYLENSPAEYI
jgi:hypothetical protein